MFYNNTKHHSYFEWRKDTLLFWEHIIIDEFRILT